MSSDNNKPIIMMKYRCCYRSTFFFAIHSRRFNIFVLRLREHKSVWGVDEGKMIDYCVIKHCTGEQVATN